MKMTNENVWEHFYKKNESFSLGFSYYIFGIFGKEVDEDKIWKDGERIISLLHPKKNDKILDACCGSFGRITIPAAKRNLRVTSVDISPTAIKLLKNRLERFKLSKKCILRKADVKKLPFSNNYFDKVFLLNTPHFQDLDKIIKEISRVTKKNGLLFINFKNSESFANYFYKNPFFQRILVGKIKMYFYPLDELKRNFTKYGLQIVDAYSVFSPFPFYMNLPLTLKQRIMKRAHGLYTNAHTWDLLIKKL